MKAKIKLETYGCAANRNHAQIMRGLLEKDGYQLVSSDKQAQLVIINSCSVKQKTENKIRHRLKQLTGKNKKLIVAGCMPLSEQEIIDNVAPQASLVGPHNCQDVVEVVTKTLEGKKVSNLDKKKEEKLCLPKSKSRNRRAIEIVEIAQGCLNQCAFCSTKLAKLGLQSYSSDNILREVKQGLNNGCKELWLTAQDTGSYGFDSGKTNLASLMNEISGVKGKFRVRVGMMNPDSALKIVDDLIEAYRSEKFYNFLHLPVQSGSNSVLEAMGRNYSVADFKEIVKIFRQELPGLTLATDLIAGYPTETKSDFQKSLDFLKEIRPDVTHVSMYGPRPGTKAKKELSPLDTEVIKKRSKKLSEVARSITEENNDKLLGKEFEVLLSRPGDEGGFEARNQNYKLVIVREGKLGEFKRVRITENKGPYLMGEVIS